MRDSTALRQSDPQSRKAAQGADVIWQSIRRRGAAGQHGLVRLVCVRRRSRGDGRLSCLHRLHIPPAPKPFLRSTQENAFMSSGVQSRFYASLRFGRQPSSECAAHGELINCHMPPPPYAMLRGCGCRNAVAALRLRPASPSRCSPLQRTNPPYPEGPMTMGSRKAATTPSSMGAHSGPRTMSHDQRTRLVIFRKTNTAVRARQT